MTEFRMLQLPAVQRPDRDAKKAAISPSVAPRSQSLAACAAYSGWNCVGRPRKRVAFDLSFKLDI